MRSARAASVAVGLRVSMESLSLRSVVVVARVMTEAVRVRVTAIRGRWSR